MTTQVHHPIVPFSEKIEVFGQTLTVIGKCQVENYGHGRHISRIWFDTIGVTGYSEKRQEVVFTLPINVNGLSYYQLLELEDALADQCCDEIFETLASK